MYNYREDKPDGMKVVSFIRYLGMDVGDSRLCFGVSEGKNKLRKKWQI